MWYRTTSRCQILWEACINLMSYLFLSCNQPPDRQKTVITCTCLLSPDRQTLSSCMDLCARWVSSCAVYHYFLFSIVHQRSSNIHRFPQGALSGWRRKKAFSREKTLRSIRPRTGDWWELNRDSFSIFPRHRPTPHNYTEREVVPKVFHQETAHRQSFVGRARQTL